MSYEKDLNMSIYYDYYGEFLTPKQRTVFEYYYNDDYSLAEIAAELGVSRQGVLDVLKRAAGKMKNMEAKLGLVQRQAEE